MRLKKLALMSMVVLATMSACGVSKKAAQTVPTQRQPQRQRQMKKHQVITEV